MIGKHLGVVPDPALHRTPRIIMLNSKTYVGCHCSIILWNCTPHLHFPKCRNKSREKHQEDQGSSLGYNNISSYQCKRFYNKTKTQNNSSKEKPFELFYEIECVKFVKAHFNHFFWTTWLIINKKRKQTLASLYGMSRRLSVLESIPNIWIAFLKCLLTAAKAFILGKVMVFFKCPTL